MKRKTVSTPSTGAVDRKLLESIEKNSEAFIKAMQARYGQTKENLVEGGGVSETLQGRKRNGASGKKTSRKLG